MHYVDHSPPSRQRGPHNDASMLDGDSAHGNPGDAAGDEWAVDTDTDVVDQAPADELEEAEDGHTPDAEAERDEEDADAGIVTDDAALDDEDAEEDGDAAATDEADAEAEENAVSDADAEAADIDSEGDARGPEPDETTLEVELAKQSDYDRAPRPHSSPATASTPFEGYAKMTVAEVLKETDGMPAEQVTAVLDFERANKNRKTLVAKLEKRTTQE